MPDRYISAIDGLRAVSIALVFASHLRPADFPGGGVGVDIFFVISGFLITSLLVREQDAHGSISLRAFYARRLLRIWPAFAVFLGFYAAAVPFLERDGGHVSVALSAASVMNWARAFELWDSPALGHTWSLAVEEQFYLLWPALLVALLGLRDRALTARAIVALVCAVVVWRALLTAADVGESRIYNGLDTRADALLIGSLLAFLPLEKLRGACRSIWPLPVAFLGGATLGLFGSSSFHNIQYTLAALSAACLVVLATDPGWRGRRWLGIPAVVYLGKLSYSLYLWHYPVMAALACAGVTGLVRIGAAVSLSLLVAMVSYHFVELPFLKLKNRLGPPTRGAPRCSISSRSPA